MKKSSNSKEEKEFKVVNDTLERILYYKGISKNTPEFKAVQAFKPN